MKKKDVLMVTHFTQIEGEKGNGRFLYIANNLDYEKINLEIVTTNFSHRTKKYREKSGKTTPYKLTLLNEPSYIKNVSLKRFYSHYIFSINVRKYLNNRTKPDLIYCSVPSLDCAYEVSKYAKKNNIKLILDIQDIWPEAFKMIFDKKIISDLIYYPMYRKAKYIYSSADKIISVSEEYLKIGLKFNKNAKGESVYLGTDLREIEGSFLEGLKDDLSNDHIKVVYIGTLGHSYNIKLIIDSISKLKNKLYKIQFIIIGDGPLKNEFENYANDKKINYKFFGRVEYKEMIGLISKCDIGVNPIFDKSAGSIINKVGDYAAMGLPVVNTQKSEEYRELLMKYDAGISCDNKIEEVKKALEILCENLEIRKKMGNNSRILFEEKFDRYKNYKKIYRAIMEE